MGIFRYQADRCPTIIIVGLFAFDLLVYALVDSPWYLSFWFVLMLFPKACICSWNHHHQHLPTFKSLILNRMLEIVYALHTGITTNAWVLHHVLGHHINYTDQKKDESGWQRKDGTTMGAVEYTLTIAATGYWRAFQVGRQHPKYQRGFLSATFLVACVLLLLTVQRPLPALFVFWLPMTWGYIATCWHTYYHHAGLDTPNEYEASYNIMHPTYNLCTGNLGYHTAHHVKPGLHWSKLPEFHAEIADKIPPHLYRKPCIPFKWFVLRENPKNALNCGELSS
jgi:fatty acid desaturase